MPAPPNLPEPIRTDGTNPFAYQTMRVRQPQMLADLLDANPDYPPIIAEELTLLRQDLLNDAPIIMLNLFPAPAPDYIEWASAHVERGGNRAEGRPSWLNTDWFFAETMMFRLIVEATRYPETRRDPYAPFKREELNSEALWDVLREGLATPGGAYERLPALARMAVWGNRMDLSYAAAASRGTGAADDDMLADDTDTLREHLLRASLGRFPAPERGVAHIVLDNAGTELAADLALADALLTGFCDVLVLHTKFYPTFVSDATTEDVLGMLARFRDGPHGNTTSPEVIALGERLTGALEEGRLRLAPHHFWNSPYFIWEMPRQLARVFEGGLVTVFKGDANYRRLVGDAIWPAETPLKQAVPDFPSPVLALRTLKSDPVLGLPPGLAARLDDEAGPDWRNNGQRGVAQLVSP